MLLYDLQADRRVGKRSMNHRGFSKVESGTCNVCSAPCSSCMHRNLGFAGSKSEESSDENCHGVAGSQCSVNEDGLLPSSMVNPRNSSHKTASEASNIVNSSHDTLSENSESKESRRCSGSRRKHEVSESANVLAQSSNCIEGQEDGILSDDQTKKSGHPNNNIVNKDPAEGSSLISDPMIEPSNDLPDKVKSQSLHNSQSNNDERSSSGPGNTKEKLGPGGNEDKGKSSVEGSAPSGQNGKDGKSSKSTSGNTSDESIPSAMSESESDGSVDVSNAVLSRSTNCSEYIYFVFLVIIFALNLPVGKSHVKVLLNR